MYQTTHRFHAEGPLMIVGGPYSNLEATRAVLKEAAQLGIPSDRVICTGDVVAYGGDPSKTVEIIRDAGWHVVMGNCEESLAAGAADCGCGFPAGSACERLSAAWFSYAMGELGNDALEWMSALPRRIEVEVGNFRFAVVHGGVDRINQFIFASTASQIKLDELSRTDCDGVISGHCGLPFSQSIDGRLWHNAGVVGMPANDGTPRVWYSILRPDRNGIAIEHRALTYDHNAAASKMRRAGLPEEYADALGSGLWPNCDVLPLQEIRERGGRLEEGRFLYQLETPSPQRSKSAPINVRPLWPTVDQNAGRKLDARKFKEPSRTLDGAKRATVTLKRLDTLWFNTGTLCNITCRNCYIESSPKNDQLLYISRSEVAAYLDEIQRDQLKTEEIGFTGGEPFMNPGLIGMLEDCLERGFRALVLTNAMRPMQRRKEALLDLNERFGGRLTIRVSVDHFTVDRHEEERGVGTFKPTLEGLIWLAKSGFNVAVAGRTMWGGDLQAERQGYAKLLAEHGVPIDANDPDKLVLFPEMEPDLDVPEISEACWDILGKSSSDVMCASSRMVIKRKEAQRPSVVACTLIPYDRRFELGSTLAEAAKSISLNHPHCATFCVLGGGSCRANGTQSVILDNGHIDKQSADCAR
jgi:MoaA/NifB/PqqE/SkfB family radical SAM enzyme/predicted phosphodiesterase